MPAGNYQYDAIGQLIHDEVEWIREIEWFRGSKKVKKIIRDDAASPELEFVYNPFGQRILKIEKPRVATVVQASSTWEYTFYTYDANGQVMAVYETRLNSLAKNVDLKERNIYGAGRIGIVNEEKLVFSATNPLPVISDITFNTLGNKQYEITNYLGNVNVVITDRKILSSPGAMSSYEAVIVMKSDYYPFGMQMPAKIDPFSGNTIGGNWNASEYRYGYNGMEKDDQVKGAGNSYTTEFRQYDPRLGRWLSLDPLMAQFPWMSPFVGFDNNPVLLIDPFGLASSHSKDGKTDNKEADPPKEKKVFRLLGYSSVDGRKVKLGTFENKQSAEDYLNAHPDAQIEDDEGDIMVNRGELDEVQVRPNRKPTTLYFDTRRSIIDAPTDQLVPGDMLRQQLYDPYGVDYSNGLFGDYREYKYLGDGEFVLTKKFNQEEEAELLLEGAMIAIPVGRVFKIVGRYIKFAGATKTGTTVLGHYPNYVKIAETIGAKTFQIPKRIWNKMSPGQQWTANKKFLDRMIMRGDKIRLATPLDQVKPGSFYQKELNYLFDRGYKVSSDGLWLVK